MSYFDSTETFDTALSEIDLLLSRISDGRNEPDGATYLKAAIVFLAAKLEAFAENIVVDYVDALSSRKPKARYISKAVKEKSTKFLLEQIGVTEDGFSVKKEVLRKLSLAASLWNDDATIDELRVNSKFNYGKHGSGEFCKLFSRIGFPDIFVLCQVTLEGSDSMIVTSGRESISADIDSLTSIRNNIVHGDANPSNVTFQQVEGYRRRIWEFCYLIDLQLQRELENLDASLVSGP